ncbi:MAG: SDR family NAD(P)-dependent oxidoreductase [Succinivibrio sp.]
MGSLKGKTVMVTGTNRGLGRELAISFASNGCNLIALSRHLEDDYLSFLEELKKNNKVEVNSYCADLSDSTSLNEALKKIARDNKQIDVLVNNAGIAFGASFHMTSIDKLKEVLEVNFVAPVKIMQAISRQMLRQKSGSIINIASVGGIETNPGYLAYGSSKAALIHASAILSKEIGPQGIRVNCIAPGLFETQMGHYKNEDELNKVISRTSLRRMGDINEIVEMALFLASDKSSFITGQTIRVDGGR